MPAYAMLDHYQGQRVEMYRIRMNSKVRDALVGIEFVRVYKASTHEYIVLKPVLDMDDKKPKSKLLRNKSIIAVSVNRYVSDGFLPAHWFGTGNKYKVKRAADGSIYICLKEVL